MCSLLPLEYYINAKPVHVQARPIEFYITNIYVKPVFFSNVQQEMEFQKLLYYPYQCKACHFDNSISYVEREIDFQLSSKPQ